MDMAKGPVLTPLASPGRISHDLMAAPSLHRQDRHHRPSGVAGIPVPERFPQLALNGLWSTPRPPPTTLAGGRISHSSPTRRRMHQ